MAFATGSGPGVDDFLDAFQAFAVSQGWIVSAYVRGTYLKISNGIAKAMIMTTSRNVTAYTGTVSNHTYGILPDAGLIGRLCTGFTPDVGYWYNQPGCPGFNQGDIGNVTVWDLTGPLTQWFFFAGNSANGDLPYIHCVIQTAGERYTHMSIGQVDKKNLTHGGAAYFVGHGDTWWQNEYIDAQSEFSYPSRRTFPFGSSQNNCYVPDALPTGSEWAVMSPGVCPTVYMYNTPTGIFIYDTPSRLCSGIGISAPSSYAGFNVLWAMPVMIQSTTGSLCYVGDYPNVRGCNMETLSPGQEISLGSDTWKIFPVQRQSNWATVGKDTQCSTGQYGIAYKKV